MNATPRPYKLRTEVRAALEDAYTAFGFQDISRAERDERRNQIKAILAKMKGGAE